MKERFQAGDLVVATMGYKDLWYAEEIIQGRLYRVIKSDSDCFRIKVRSFRDGTEYQGYYSEHMFEFMD